MANIFNSVQGMHPRFNSFSAHTYRNDFTAELGLNIPVYQQHVLPGSLVRVNTFALARLQALISPIMDNLDLYVHFWKLPYRLIEGDRFTQFISGEISDEEYTLITSNGITFSNDLAEYISNVIPDDVEGSDPDASKKAAYLSIVGNGGIFDFLGYDLTWFASNFDAATEQSEGSKEELNFRPLVMYYMLHDNWYMNENVPYFEDFHELVEGLKFDEGTFNLIRLLVTTYTTFGYSFLPHGWDKDYFTSALPNVQYGDPVRLSLAGSAPVSVNVTPSSPVSAAMIGVPILPQGEGLNWANNQSPIMKVEDGVAHLQGVVDDSSLQDLPGFVLKNLIGVTGTGNVDLSQVSAITINELRFANALQVFKERQMRFGRRRQEFYKGFFDVTPEDLRLQLPKYLGGGRIPINISDVEQTSATQSGQPLGRLGGKGTAVAGGFAGFNTYVSEESILMGICFVMPHITYANGISRFLLKKNDRYDYFNPSFEHLGEQPVFNIEIFGGSEEPEGEFGYQPRFTEYRFHSNEMHGQFKDSLSFWTLGRIFDDQPALNADFVYMQPKNFDRIFAVSGQPNLLCSMIFKQRIVQPVSKYGTPMLLA